VFREHEAFTLRYFWDEEYGKDTTKQVYFCVNGKLVGETISRATIINFLAHMGERGVLGVSEKSGKGGYQAVYTARMDEVNFRKYVLSMVRARGPTKQKTYS
jgi:predicted transcriptional regulator